MPNFEVLYLDDVIAFFDEIDKKAKEKLLYNVSKAKQFNDVSLFKKLKGTNIWEFRANTKGTQYRLLAFWDTNKKALVVCTHGIIKKTAKTPKSDIEKAETIRNLYLKL